MGTVTNPPEGALSPSRRRPAAPLGAGARRLRRAVRAPRSDRRRSKNAHSRSSGSAEHRQPARSRRFLPRRTDTRGETTVRTTPRSGAQKRPANRCRRREQPMRWRRQCRRARLSLANARTARRAPGPRPPSLIVRQAADDTPLGAAHLDPSAAPIHRFVRREHMLESLPTRTADPRRPLRDPMPRRRVPAGGSSTKPRRRGS